MKTSFHVNQTTKFNSYLYYLVKVEDRVIFQSVWMIYDIGISLYNTTINSNIPNIEYLRKNALTYNEEHEFEGEDNEY